MADNNTITPTPENPIPDVDEIKPGIPDPAWKDEGGGSGGGGALIVHATWGETTGTLDKTWQEIYNAYVAGNPVYLDPSPEEMTMDYGRTYLVTVYLDGKIGYAVGFGDFYGANVTFITDTANDYPVTGE